MTEISPSLHAALADRYRIEGELGRGGMATVYHATDIRHRRQVAIKVLDQRIAGVVSVDRFLQEIRVMATLQHPHILPLFDSGEAAGELYYVMPRVEGETLRARLAREGRLGLADAARITREVASALDFAHRKGVVHRDIKPENILFSDGLALVADFGIARAIVADVATAERLTATGLSLGTPGYMSPEQAAGNEDVDARTDVYALGAVTHEMLAGAPPFSGPSVQAVLARVLTESPPALSAARAGISASTSGAVQKALARDPAGRYPGALEFSRALDATIPARNAAGTGSGAGASRPGARRPWPVIAAAAAVLLAGAWFLTRGAARSGSGATPVRVAVVPFRETGEVGNSGFAAGLVTALRNDLATLPNVEVIPGTSVQALGDSARTPRYVARVLGATHVLSGTVQWNHAAGGEVRVRIVPELIAVNGSAEQAKSADAIEERVDDLFAAQSRVSNLIASSLGVEVSAQAAARLAKPPTRSLAAYEAFLRAQYANDPVPLLQQAVSLDSTFAQAWAELGRLAGLSYQGTLDPTIAELARRSSATALALDSTSGVAHLAMALYQRHVLRNFPEALRHAQEAMRLGPGNVGFMHFAAAAMWNAGRIDDALALARRGAALDPFDASALARVATILIWKRDFVAAEAATGRALKASKHGTPFINLDSVLIPAARGDTRAARAFVASIPAARDATTAMIMREWHLGWLVDSAHAAGGMLALRKDGLAYAQHVVAAQQAWLAHDARRQAIHADSAIRSTRERLQKLPGEERIRMALAFAYAYAGRFREAVIQGDSANATRSAWKDAFQGATLSLNFAEVLAMSGEKDHAIALADSLLKVPGFVTPDYLRVDPYFESVRGDARFRKLTTP